MCNAPAPSAPRSRPCRRAAILTMSCWRRRRSSWCAISPIRIRSSNCFREVAMQRITLIASAVAITLLAAMADARIVIIGRKADVVVYGGSAGGVIAAVAAAREGKHTILIVEGKHVGGMVSGGLGATDVGNAQAIGGYSREF